jgi:hypothetical protein
MIRHVVVFTWKPEATAEQRERVKDELTALAPLMPGLRRYTCGPDVRIVDGNADFGIVADFDDANAYFAYRDHPAHQAVISEVTRPIMAHRAGIQFEV